MGPLLETIVNQIQEKNPLHAKKLKSNISSMDESFHNEAEVFFQRYIEFAKVSGYDLNFGIDSYLKVISDQVVEQVGFLRTGEYSCKSFEDAYNRVYNNHEVMTYYMHGLLMSQFLWVHHHGILNYFRKNLPSFSKEVTNYLEIGGGHGLYLSEAINIFSEDCEFTMVDISKSSLDMGRNFVRNEKVKFILEDIYKYSNYRKFDFITMGEVLEHVEDPVALMCQVNRLLSDNGTAFITVPANAPAIDHIYLFENENDILEVFDKAGFKVINKIIQYSEDLPKEKLIKFKVPMMYGALLKKK